MKFTIELTPAEVQGIKNYLKSTDSDYSNAAVRQHIQGIVSSTIYAPSEAVSDYIQSELQRMYGVTTKKG